MESLHFTIYSINNNDEIDFGGTYRVCLLSGMISLFNPKHRTAATLNNVLIYGYNLRFQSV